MSLPLPDRFVDTHAHLADPAFDVDREEVLARAWAAGLNVVVEIADTEAGWAKARALADHPSGRVWWSVGFHPYVADQFDAGTVGRLTEALRHPRAVAVGEIGLDYFKHCAVPRPRQREVFEALARAGVAAGKPLVLHCRESSPDSTDAENDMLAILEKVFRLSTHDLRLTSPHGVAHCFQGTLAGARRFLDLGFLLGVDGPVTYPKAESLRTVLSGVPLESLVLETDCPYLPPQSFRGKRNEPAYLPAAAAALANLKGVPAGDVARITTGNAARLYRFSVDSVF